MEQSSLHSPSWASIRRAFTRPTFGSQQRSDACLQVIDILERRLGTSWPESAARARSLNGLTYMANSNPDFLEQLALRLEETWELSGRRSVVNSLRTDFGPGRWQHVCTQLELASLAILMGWHVSFEQPVAEGGPPLDVVLRRDGILIPIEVKSVLSSDHDDEVHQESSAFNSVYYELLTTYDVLMGGTLPGIPSEVGRAQILEALRPVAALVQRDHQARNVDVGGARLTLTWAADAQGAVELSMPMPLQDDAYRMPQKIRPKDMQATKSGARWLRLDMLGNYFYLSRWVYQPFALQVNAIVGDLLRAAEGTTFDGIVISSGRRVTGRCNPETVTHSSDATGLLRQVTPLESRSTVVLPLTEVGEKETPALVALYDDEMRWLIASLERYELPTLDVIMGGGDPP